MWGKDRSQTKDNWIHYQWRLEALESTDREQVYPVEILKFKKNLNLEILKLMYVKESIELIYKLITSLNSELYY